MIKKYRQILNIYFRHTHFIILSVVLLISAIISKFLYVLREVRFAEEFSTLLFVVTLWLAFYLGLLLKRQFANYRASLLPGFRKPHVHCLIFIYIFFILAAVAWIHGLRLSIQIAPSGLQGVYISCFFAAVIITYLGYLSIGRVAIYVYLLSLLLAMNVSNIITIFESFSSLKYILGALLALFIIFFIKRLKSLKEHHFEYPYLLSWPAKNFFINQMKSDQFASPIKRILKVKEGKLNIPQYAKNANIFLRSLHWDYTEYTDVKILGMLMILSTPLYLLFIKNNLLFASFFKNTYSNFLLLSITPVLITVGSYYKRMAYWGYDLLKPITKRHYFLERGIILLMHLFIYWLVFIICFALLPSIVFQPHVYKLPKFWGFLLLTGNFALFSTMWLTWISCLSDGRVIVLSGIIFSHIILFQFYFAASFSISMIIVMNIICFFFGGIFLRAAYKAWCQREFL